MAFNHGDFYIPGTHENPKVGEWTIEQQFNKPFGLEGATVLYGGKANRPIDIRHFIWYEWSTVDELRTYLASLEARIGVIADLEELNYVPQTIPNVQFLGYAQEDGPIPPNAHIGWMSYGILRFLQLAPGGAS